MTDCSRKKKRRRRRGGDTSEILFAPLESYILRWCER